MSDSYITKRAIANALKELLEELPFEKIRVYDICNRCHLNRNSFYYHFRDKYDLVNWIFDTEFIAFMKEHLPDDSKKDFSTNNQWDSLEIACQYFYENRRYYRKVLSVQGQNSLSSHFRELLYPIQHSRIEELLGEKDVPMMVYYYVVDGIDRAIELWLLDKNCISVEEFMYTLKKISEVLLKTFRQQLEDHPHWTE